MAGGEKRTAWWRDHLIFSNELMMCPSLTDEPLWQNLISNYLQLTNINQQLTCMTCGPGQAWRLLPAGLFSSPAFCWSGRGAADVDQTADLRPAADSAFSDSLIGRRRWSKHVEEERPQRRALRAAWGYKTTLKYIFRQYPPCFIYQSSSFIFWCIFTDFK